MGEPFVLDIPPGIVSDDTTFASKGRWADCDGIRFRGGRPETLPGSTLNQTVSADQIHGIGFAVFKVIVGTVAKLYSLNMVAGTKTDITPAPAPSSAGWSFANWGATTVLACVRGAKLYESNTSTTATHVSTAPASINKIIVTPQRQVLALACNAEAGGSQNVRCIRGCDLEDYTDWTTSATNNAFEHILDDPGGIIDGDLIESYVAVWTETSLFLGTFIGDPAQTYRFDRVLGGAGMVYPGAYCILNGIAYWLAPDHNIYRWAPGAPVEPVPCPIWRDFTLNYNSGAAFMYALPRHNEIWLHYNDTRDSGSCSRYIAMRVDDGSWIRGRSTIQAAFVSPLLNENILGSVDSGAFVSGGSGGEVYIEATGTRDAASYLQSADQYIDSGRRRMMVQGVTPDFEQQTGDVDLTLFVRDRPQSSATTKGPYTLAAAATKKDFRASGMLTSVKFGAAAGVKWRLGVPTFDVVPLGER